MKNTTLTPEQEENIKDLARIGVCADLLAEISFKSGISPEICSVMVINLAKKKVAELKANKG